LASITEAGFPALRLDEVVPLRERESMDDAAMVEYLLRCGLTPHQPRPSIETLLHAFIPALHVDHTHPDAIIALTSSPAGRVLADTDGVVLEVDRSPEAVAFASSVRAPEVSQVGAPCPDHLINTKHKPLVARFDPDVDDAAALGDSFRHGVEEYAAWYREYYERNLDDETRRFPIDPAGPRVVLV